MTYTSEQVEELNRGCEDALRALEELWLTLAHDFAPTLTVERAREYVGHGIFRRLKTIRSCIENIFTIFPAGRTELLSEEERSNVQINLHAFFINIHGVPDNLAWAYVIEKSLEMKIEGGRNGIGLFHKNTKLHLPDQVCDYLYSEPIKSWQKDYAKNYRDALAHRIPPYIPPSIQGPTQQERYKELDHQITEAVKHGNFDHAQTLTEEQDTIGAICPAFLHSFLDTTACSPVLMHPQIIVDAKTVMEIISKIRPHFALPSALSETVTTGHAPNPLGGTTL